MIICQCCIINDSDYQPCQQFFILKHNCVVRLFLNLLQRKDKVGLHLGYSNGKKFFVRNTWQMCFIREMFSSTHFRADTLSLWNYLWNYLSILFLSSLWGNKWLHSVCHSCNQTKSFLSRHLDQGWIKRFLRHVIQVSQNRLEWFLTMVSPNYKINHHNKRLRSQQYL